MIYRRIFGLPTLRIKRRFNELEHMRQQMDQIFGELNRGSVEKSISNVFPTINSTENIDNYYIRSELPGVKAKRAVAQIKFQVQFSLDRIEKIVNI
jgi:HSP20 family protein